VTSRIEPQPETESVAGGRLGRHIEHDERSKNFRAVATAPLPTFSKVWARHTVFDQGALGSCTGNAIAGIGATNPFRVPHRRYDEHLAVKIYKRATVLDPFDGTYPPDDTGSSGLAACKAAVEYGLTTAYRWGFGVEDLAQIVATLGPCAVGTDWMSGMDTPDPSGLVTIGGYVRGGHEYEVIGWHADTQRFECVNSWGQTWGLRGRFFVSFDDMGTLLARGGDAVTFANG
jgi:hypothetical protein